MTSIESLAQSIRSAEPIAGIRIAAVDGPSGAGKSTLAKLVAAELAAPLIQIDDFLSWNSLTDWWPRFDAEVLRPLLAGDAVRFRKRDWVNDEFGDALGDVWEDVPWSPIVVIEGVGCSRREAAAALVYTIWVETPEPERLRRGIERDGEDHRRLWDRWMLMEAEFLAADGTRERASAIVPGV